MRVVRSRRFVAAAGVASGISALTIGLVLLSTTGNASRSGLLLSQFSAHQPDAGEPDAGCLETYDYLIDTANPGGAGTSLSAIAADKYASLEVGLTGVVVDSAYHRYASPLASFDVRLLAGTWVVTKGSKLGACDVGAFDGLPTDGDNLGATEIPDP